ncbi:hypothetical protein AVDCRST_MAG84-987 [uncultured Microcoleus sp.]|uniref:Uncharacterized protein n=1 Tax=uncultured Microcoleus sp. TaxID=259945 RepID=A0A6J4KY10_9CYAN|nr:hypothetical protein AVDCRST_MAG84-987 [uncultured Microcoleus sp.]
MVFIQILFTSALKKPSYYPLQTIQAIIDYQLDCLQTRQSVFNTPIKGET